MTTEADETSPLADLLCFDLYAASRAVTARYRGLLAEHDLTYPQYLVLLMLDRSGLEPTERPEGQCVPSMPARASVRELASALQLDHSTLTPLLRRLEHAGLVERARNRHDERVVDVTLTAAGRAVAQRFDEVQDGMRDAMGLSPRDARSLQVSLRTLAASVAER